ncbi:MAG: PKD domain-containing protein [Saprospiraceae bacterium]|nr:PKD domain-containing protein [Saprospiraceae bacterium]
MMILAFYSEFNWVNGQSCQVDCMQLIRNCELSIKEGVTIGVNAYDAQNSLIEGWRCAFETPHHVVVHNNTCHFTSIFSGSPFPFLDQFPNSVTCVTSQQFSPGEGFYQNLERPIRDSECLNYTLRVRSSLMPCSNIPQNPGRLHVRLSNLLNNNNFDCQNIIPANTYTNSFLVIDEPITNNAITTFEVELDFEDLLSDFAQIWLYAETGFFSTIAIHDVSLFCTTDALGELNFDECGTTVGFSADNECEFAFETFRWDFGDGNVSTEPSPTHTYQNPGNYLVCLEIFDVNGCCASKCSTINVQELILDPSFTISGNCPIFQFTPNTPNQDVTYFWNFGDNLGTSNVQNPTYQYADNGTYTVTLVVTDACHNTASSTQQVVVDCIQPPATLCGDLSGYTIIDGGTSGVLLTDLIEQNIISSAILFSGNFILNGNLIINTHAIFFNTNWVCNPGSQITMNSNLSLWETHINGCDQMWRGILNNGRQLAIFGGSVNDAENAIFIRNQSTVFASGTRFDKNYNSVFIPPATQTQNINLSLSYNRFTCDGVLLPSYSGQENYPQIPPIRSYSGINVSNLMLLHLQNSFLPGFDAQNIFDNLSYGIISTRTRNNLNGNIFTQSFNHYDSYGISIDQPIGVNSISNNSITNHGGAITIQRGLRVPITLSNNLVRDQITPNPYGMLFGRLSSARVNILNNNRFEMNSGVGINFLTSNRLSHLDVTNIKMNGLMRPFEFNDTHTSDQSSPGVHNNDITLHQTRPSRLISSKHINFINNDFINTETNPGINSEPIFIIENSERNLFRRNIMTNTPKAFNIEMSNTNIYCCNESEATGESVLFDGGLSISSFKNNKLNNLRLDQMAIMGEQINAGNQWVGSNNSANMNPLDITFPYITANQFVIDEDQPGGRPQSVFPDVWFRQGGESSDCESLPNCGIGLFPELPPGGWGDPEVGDTIMTPTDPDYCRGGFYTWWRAIVNGQVSAGLYTDQYLWATSKYLYEQMDVRHPEFWKRCIRFDSFYIDSDDIYEWAETEKEEEVIRKMTGSQISRIEALYDAMEPLTLEYIGLLNELPSTDFVLLDSLGRMMAALTDTVRSIENEYYTSLRDNAFELIAKISLLPEPYPFLILHKSVWQMQLRVLIEGDDVLTNTEWDQLRAIANMCPLEVGNVVYRAQNLMAIKGEMIYTDMASVCDRTELRKKSESSKNGKLSIYPNPTNGQIMINLPDDVQLIRFFISDITGKFIEIKQTENINNNLLQFDVSQLEGGVYFMKMIDQNEKIYQSRIIVIH